MSIRDKSYKDYGLTDARVNELIKICKSRISHIDNILMECCVEAKEEIARDLYYTLVSGLSYEKLEYFQDIPMPIVDFYGYRRKALALFDERLKRMNK